MTRLIFISLLFPSYLFANHNAAGEITFEQIDERTIRATIHTYTKLSTVGTDRDSLQLCWGDGTCEFVQRNSETLLMFDRKHNQYIATHEYDDFGEYTLHMSDPSRNDAVNFSFGSSTLFHLQTTFKLSADFNSGPIFLEAPFPIAYVGKPYFHYPNAWDADGDSLVFKLAIPFADLDSVVTNYSYPNQTPIDNGIFGINPETGLVFWDSPGFQGEYVFAFIVNEFRNGELISTTLRDIELLALANFLPNEAPFVSVEEEVIVVSPGELVSFDVTFEDEDNDIMVMATGGPFLVNDPAVFDAPIGVVPPPQVINFSWQPTMAHNRSQPYHLVFSAIDDDPGFKMIGMRLVKVFVRDEPLNTGINIFKNNWDIFPNPSNGKIWVNINEPDYGNGEFILSDIYGRELWREKTGLKTNMELDFGTIKPDTYILYYFENGEILGWEKLVVQQ